MNKDFKNKKLENRINHKLDSINNKLDFIIFLIIVFVGILFLIK